MKSNETDQLPESLKRVGEQIPINEDFRRAHAGEEPQSPAQQRNSSRVEPTLSLDPPGLAAARHRSRMAADASAARKESAKHAFLANRAAARAEQSRQETRRDRGRTT